MKIGDGGGEDRGRSRGGRRLCGGGGRWRRGKISSLLNLEVRGVAIEKPKLSFFRENLGSRNNFR